KQLVILSLMKSGMSNSDMADTLFLSTNTIKTHIRLMYTTLDVNSRIECLNKAEELNLLSE
ncbi:helix-turn-helix transcriptional regulator, partial [Thalassolituus sp. UBA1505]